MKKLNPDNVRRRMLNARADFMLSEHALKHFQDYGVGPRMVCKLPPGEYAQWQRWIDQISSDPYVGPEVNAETAKLLTHCFGMDIVEDTSVTKIEVTYAHRKVHV